MERDKRGYSDEDLREVSDNPEWTAEDFANAKPFAEVFPEFAAAIKSKNVRILGSKGLISVELAEDIIDRYKADGPGWEARIEDDLRKARKRGARPTPSTPPRGRASRRRPAHG